MQLKIVDAGHYQIQNQKVTALHVLKYKNSIYNRHPQKINLLGLYRVW